MNAGKIAIPPSVADAIKRLAAGWLNEPDQHGLHSVVRERGALPVYLGIGGALLLTPDGDILGVAWDSREGPKREENPSLRLTAVVAGAEKYPELRPLVPVRPPDAKLCTSCGGQGFVLFSEKSIRCGECFGLGWPGAAV
jgi:hypothetical protein